VSNKTLGAKLVGFGILVIVSSEIIRLWSTDWYSFLFSVGGILLVFGVVLIAISFSEQKKKKEVKNHES